GGSHYLVAGVSALGAAGADGGAILMNGRRPGAAERRAPDVGSPAGSDPPMPPVKGAPSGYLISAITPSRPTRISSPPQLNSDSSIFWMSSRERCCAFIWRTMLCVFLRYSM